MKLLRIPLLVGLLAVMAPAVRAQDDPGTPFRHLSEDETITANFIDEDLATVLDLFSSSYALNIVSGPNVGGKVTMNLYEAPVQLALEKILATNGYTYKVEGNFILVTDEQAGSATPLGGGASPFEPQVIFLNHMRAQDVVPMIQPLLDFNESLIEGPSSETGIDVSATGGNAQGTREMVLFLGSEKTNKKIRALLLDIDIPPPQVLVEATILQVTLSDDFSLGVDFSVLGGVDFRALDGQTDASNSLTKEGRITPTKFLGSAGTQGFNNPTANGLHIGILQDQFSLFMNALEEVGNATVLSNPSVMAINRHAAQVLVGRKIGYLTLQQTETSTVQTVEFLEVGTSLVFRPFVSDDGYIRLEIKPKNSDGLVSATTGLPEESTTEVTTNIIVRDGHTVVIGGLIEKSMATSVSQVPLLGSIPVIGALFRSESQREQKSEIIILLTPRIVGDSELSRRADDARRRFESLEASITASHYGYLRPSYARELYSEAATALAAGNPALALAKSEWGLQALPSDPDLAMLASHCREELRATQYEEVELQTAIELLDRLNAEKE